MEQWQVEEGAAAEVAEAPTWTLTAQKRFDIEALVGLVNRAEILAQRGDFDPGRLAAMRETLREFEFYEERHRATAG